MKITAIRQNPAATLTLLGLGAICAACSPMRSQVDANPAGYIVSSYSHTGASDGEGSQAFALSTNPTAGGIESGAVYLESVNGGNYSVSSTYVSGYNWPQYTLQGGGLLLNAPGSFNNHLIILAPPATRSISSVSGVSARPPTSMPSAVPRAMTRSIGSRAASRPASRSTPRGGSNGGAQVRTR